MKKSFCIGILAASILKHQLPVHALAVRPPSSSNQGDSGKKKKGTLTFNADVELTSDTIQGQTRGDIAGFFRQKECRDLLLSAGGTKKIQELPMEEDLVALWKDCCEHWGPEMLPEDGDTIVSVQSEIGFPGLRVLTTACSAVKLRENANNSPMYESLFIAEKLEAVGPAPLVWLYNQLTGNAKRPKDKFLAPSAKAKGLMSIVEKENTSYAIKFALDFQIDMVFPDALLRILPASRKKMEEQGSAAVYKAVAKDAQNALKGAVEAFNKRRSASLEPNS